MCVYKWLKRGDDYDMTPNFSFQYWVFNLSVCTECPTKKLACQQKHIHLHKLFRSH
jgi:hypothetical protein